MERLSALTMPVVTVFDRPSGAPTAIGLVADVEVGRVAELDGRQVLGILRA